METIDGIIEHIRYHKANRFNPSGMPFLIAGLHNGVTVKGEMRHPAKGEAYRFYGQYKDQKGGYGQAFEFSSAEPVIERSESGIAAAIAAHVPGIGRVKACSLVGAFGTDTLDVLRSDPAKALEVKGLTQAHVDAIRQWFDDRSAVDPVAYARLVDLLAEHRIPKRVVDSLLKNFGSDAARMVRENPYILMDYPRVGWKIADSLALSKCDYPPEGIERHKAAILEAMERIASDGHTVAGFSEVYTTADSLLGMEARQDAMLRLIEEGDVIIRDSEHEAAYQLAALADAEETIARKLAELQESASPLPNMVTSEWVEAAGLSEEQAEAARLVNDFGVSIITGAPGTGKTYTLSRVLGRLAEIGVQSIRVVAPTGKAAKRAEELIGQVHGLEGVPCTTIHRALGPTPATTPAGIPSKEAKCLRGREEFGFAKNESSPIEAQVIDIDEASMVDVRLMASLLRAIAPGTRLIIVGDPNQLPSVGPGSVLRDLLAAGIPHVELTQIRRSDGGGRVVKACHAIKDGRIPQPAAALELPTENWVHVERSEPSEIAETIRDLVVSTKTFDPIWEVQCISAQKARLAFACDNLNQILAAQLNPLRWPYRNSAPEDSPPFVAGDKVIRTSNGVADELKPFTGDISAGGKITPDFTWGDAEWSCSPCPVVNGDMGEVIDIAEGDKGGIIVRFRDPARLCRLAWSEHNLQLAYALTVHKAQGSGFPFVIVPVHHSFFWDHKKGQGLWSRELFYTAISRAEKLLVTVGQWSAIEAAVGRKTVRQRRTSLAGRLARATEKSEAYVMATS